MHNRTIIARHLVKRYQDLAAVDDVSFTIDSGEIFGFLGPNGAGKSTTVAMLTTLGLPTTGTATVGGFDVVRQAVEVRRITGVALQAIGLDPLMKARDLLTIQGQMYNMTHTQARRRADELLTLVRLTDAVDRPVGKYSGGMRRRLDLALALVHEPQILFLDEPTAGLDPASRHDIWTEVHRLNEERGMTIFLTTQYLEEADHLADRVAIINAGRIVTEGRPAALKAELGSEAINVEFAQTESMIAAYDVLTEHTTQIQQDGTLLRLYLPNAARAVPEVVNRLTHAGLQPVSLTLTQPTLDDVFLRVTGHRFDPALTAQPD